MTDKEQINDSLKNQNKNFNENFTCENRTVIIDGIDVSKCGFIHPEISKTQCHIALAFSDQYEECTNCEQIEDCYFKQLARKTTECEELKESVDKIKNYVKNQMFDVDCKNWFDRFIYTFEDWKKSICEANDRYRKALEEVEEILEYYATSFIDPLRYPDVHYDTSCAKLGLDIISKAKGEE